MVHFKLSRSVFLCASVSLCLEQIFKHRDTEDTEFHRECLFIDKA